MGTASWEHTVAALRAIVDAASTPIGSQLLGVHMEGPYLSPDRRGAMRVELMRTPDRDEVTSLQDIAQGMIKVMTVAPEREGGLGLVEHLACMGIVPAIGHSDATFRPGGGSSRQRGHARRHIPSMRCVRSTIAIPALSAA